MSDSTFKILLSTDNHLGFAERDPRRGDDSFTTFEEVLRAARTEHDVDLMLLGGDLFHENKPSLGCLVRSCSLFRKYVYGNKEIAFSLLSDPAVNFPTHALPMANFQDPNINVALPVFAIHGNHDDPVGGTSSLDLLATNGYLNYFGHVASLEEIVVEPVLLRKGHTFIALYGLGNVRDERLHRCFRLKKVQFIYPKPVPGRKWFNILLVHQNRGVRGAAGKNGIFESMLAGFGMDLVIWGNEHEQRMVPQPSDGFDVVQPGSTVLTSLSAQECNPKQYGILEVRGTSYRLTPYPLRSVRPVVRRTVELREDVPDGRTLDAVETFLHGVMADMIREAEDQVARIPDDVLTFHPNIKYPLIRLAVDFTDVTSAPYPQPNFNRFGQQYMDVVANPGELLRPIKPKPERRPPGTALGPAGSGMGGAVVAVPAAPQLNTLDIRVKVAEVFNNNAKNACMLLSESELSAAVYAFAEKGERDAIDERLMELLHTSQKSVWRRMEGGASDSILNPNRVAEEVVTHKRHVNERYARAAQVEDAQLQRQRQGHSNVGGGAEEEEAEEGEDSSGGGTAARARPGRWQQLDVFETVRIAPQVLAGPVPSSSSRPPQSDERDGDGGGGDGGTFSRQMNVSTLVLQAIQQDHSMGSAARPSGAGALHPQRVAAVHGGSAPANEEDEEDGGEELPGDGLDRVSLDNVVAQAVHQQQQQQHAPLKRSRSNTATPVPGALQRGNGDDGDNIDADVVVEDGEDVAARGDESGRARRPTTATTAAASKKSRTTSGRGAAPATAVSTSSTAAGAGRQRGGRRATAANTNGGLGSAGANGGPTLTLMAHQGASAMAGHAGGALGVQHHGSLQQNRQATAPSASASKGAMLDLLSKWTGGSQQ